MSKNCGKLLSKSPLASLAKLTRDQPRSEHLSLSSILAMYLPESNIVP